MKRLTNLPMRKERRRHPRVRIDWPVVIQREDRATAGVATDISASGLLIRTDKPPLPQERLQLFILVPEREAIKVKSAVSWSQADFCQNDFYPSGVGVRFTRVSRPDRAFLTDWIHGRLDASVDDTSLTVRTPKLALTFRSIEGT
jgi:PilZ domain